MEDKQIIKLLFARELGRAIDKFLEKQSKIGRYIFVRRYWYGDSIAVIANELDMKENTVSVRLNRMRTSLKIYLKKEGYYYEA